MDPQSMQKLVELEQKIDQIYVTTEKVRKYFLWTLIVTLAMVVLPAIGLVFAIPSFLSTYSNIDSITSGLQ